METTDERFVPDARPRGRATSRRNGRGAVHGSPRWRGVRRVRGAPSRAHLRLPQRLPASVPDARFRRCAFLRRGVRRTGVLPSRRALRAGERCMRRRPVRGRATHRARARAARPRAVVPRPRDGSPRGAGAGAMRPCAVRAAWFALAIPLFASAAGAAPRYTLVDTVGVPAPPPDRATLVLTREEYARINRLKPEELTLDTTPLGVLPQKTWLAAEITPGRHCLHGLAQGDDLWFEARA